MKQKPIHPGPFPVQRGFTLIELVVTLMILGIMAFAVIPRMSLLGGFDARGYSDQMEAWLRFAQKSALAQRRMVALDLSTSPPTLRQSTATNCDTGGSVMGGPGGWRAPAASTSMTHALGSPVCFDAMGRPYAPALLTATQTIVFRDAGTAVRTIAIEPETGYIHD